MNFSRRQFLSLGAGALAAATAGCDDLTKTAADARVWMGLPTAPPLDGPLDPPRSADVDLVSHLLSRLTFGARPGDYARAAALGADAFIEAQLAPEKMDDWLCDRRIRHDCDSLSDPESKLFPLKRDGNDPLMALFPDLKNNASRVGDLYEYKERVLLQELTRATLLRSILSRRQLYEVMVQFWSDHFNIDPSKGECKWLKAADDRDVIRVHALGNFRDLLRASAVSPAMLWYLDGRVNRHGHPEEKPNENYARELMELHTLGVHGGYTQQDVIEVARCLSGWTVRDKKHFFKGRVEFQAKEHDDGAKRVLGETIPAGLGARDLDRVLEIVVAHPSTARHLAWKLCRRFISDDPPASAVEATAKTFTASRGDIRATLRALFASVEFRAPETRGLKFKRPFHFVVSALRAANARTDASPALVEYLQRLGHAPFRYPTPDGYPEEARHWQSTLLWRWNFASALAENRIKGTTVTAPELTAALGGDDALMATFLGRKPSDLEARAYHESGPASRSSSPPPPSNAANERSSSPHSGFRFLVSMNAQALITGNGDATRTLIAVFLRGAADGLTLVPPIEDDHYYKARQRLGITKKDAVKLDDRFGFHPKLADLASAFHDGELAIVHAAGSEDKTRSHFDAQDLMEHGGIVAGGWLGRFLRSRSDAAAGALTCVAVGKVLPESLSGAPTVTVMQSLDEFSLGAKSTGLRPGLEQLYALEHGQLGAAARDTFEALQRIDAMRNTPYHPDGGAEYASDEFSTGLRQIARLIKAGVGLEAASIDIGGWDSHFTQETLMDPLMIRLNKGLHAFRRDMGSRMATTTVVVMTEFGRSVEENSSFGTDHGRGSTMFVLGGGVQGGRVHGAWKGLAPSGLEQRGLLENYGDLPVLNNYRNILAPILTRHGAATAAMPQIFPDFALEPMKLYA